jgi:hypothetical protein
MKLATRAVGMKLATRAVGMKLACCHAAKMLPEPFVAILAPIVTILA